MSLHNTERVHNLCKLQLFSFHINQTLYSNCKNIEDVHLLFWRDLTNCNIIIILTKDYTIAIYWFSPKHVALRSYSKDLLILNQNNVLKRSDMYTHGLLFQSNSTKNPSESVGLVQSRHHRHCCHFIEKLLSHSL